jgi:hypothetical protein
LDPRSNVLVHGIGLFCVCNNAETKTKQVKTIIMRTLQLREVQAVELGVNCFIKHPRNDLFFFASTVEKEFDKITLISEVGVNDQGGLITRELTLKPNATVLVLEQYQVTPEDISNDIIKSRQDLIELEKEIIKERNQSNENRERN